MTLTGADARRAALLLVGLAAAVAMRVALAGPAVAASVPAGVAFAGVLGVLAVAGGLRAGRVRTGAVAAGVAGGALIVAPWLLAGHGVALPGAHPSGDLAWWTAGVITVAAAEEALLRGALFTALQRWGGAPPALIVTTFAFALMHLPLYGVAALPVDAAVGLLLGGLRLLTGGWVAPAVAHVLADVAGGWL